MAPWYSHGIAKLRSQSKIVGKLQETRTITRITIPQRSKHGSRSAFYHKKKGHQQEHQAYSLHIDRPSRDGSRLFDSLHDPSKHIYRRPLHRVVAHANHEVTQRPHAAYYDASPNGGSLLGRPDPDGRAHAAAAPAAAEQLSTTASSLYGGASVASHCSTVNSCCAHPLCGPVTVTST